MAELGTRWANVRELLEESPEFHTSLRAIEPPGDGAALDGTVSAPSWLTALAEAAYLVATADGIPPDADRNAITEGLVEVSEGHLTPAHIEAAFARVSTAVHGEASKLLHEIALTVTDSSLQRAVILVALAAGIRNESISERQNLVLHALAHAFGLSEGKLQSLIARARQVI